MSGRNVSAGAVLLCAVLTAGPAGAQRNLGFEEDAAATRPPPGWRVRAGGRTVVLDEGVSHEGAHSLRVSGGDGAARLTQTVSSGALKGDRLRLSGYLRVENVDTGAAALWLRIDGPDHLLYIDGMRDRGASGTADWTRYTIDAPLFETETRITFGATFTGSGTAWLDDVTLEGVGTDALPPPSAAAANYVDRALQIMEEHSIRRSFIDWPTFRAKVMAQARGAQTETDAYLALRYALAELRDGHSYLMTRRQAAILNAAPVSNARTLRRALQPRGQRLVGNVGYVSVPGYGGGTHDDQVRFATDLQTIISELDVAGACGWIVDLRGNRGGNLWPMLVGVGPLLGDGIVGASVYPDGTRIPLEYRLGQGRFGDYVQLRVNTPYQLAGAPEPVAVLTDALTASSAETVAMAFRGRPATRSFGDVTRGVNTGNRTFPLSDGAALILTVAATADRAGRIDTAGLTPDEPVDADADGVALEAQPVVDAALRWLESQAACRRD